MNIAIVGPSPVPFAIGGMEYLLKGLQDHFSNMGGYKVELIKLPTKEDSFWNIIESYKQFYYLDVSHFDMVITVKYPAWMIQHKNHICYMAHRLRGVYDTYHFMNLPIEVPTNDTRVNEIVKYIDSYKATIQGLFDRLDELYKYKDEVEKSHMALPSPFLRRILHFLDNEAMVKGRVKRFYAISNTVKERKEYFPIDADVKVVYPPSALPEFRCRDYEYLFTISRLDSPKRIDLMIEAMKHVKGKIHLKIAGTGPMEKQLKAMAKKDPRIEFLGFINDSEVIEYYANAKAILFMPYEEDYGLVTIEAMMSKKPVITCYDSGGPKEFVQDYKTGFVVDANPVEIANKINYLDENISETIKMGQNAFEKVQDITWDNVIRCLTGDTKDSNVIKIKKRITLTSTFPIYPALGGGQVRTYQICKWLGKAGYEVNILSLTNNGQKEINEYIAQEVKEDRTSKTYEHQQKEYEVEKQVKIPVSDIMIPRLIQLTPSYLTKLASSIQESDIIIVSHPYLFKEVKKRAKNKTIIYDAQDVEYIIKKQMFPNLKITNELLKELFELEEECCVNSEFIICCSEEDKNQLSELYKISEDKIIVIPNGVDTSQTKFTKAQKRIQGKRKLGLSNEKLGLFMGSWHKPNLVACEQIFKVAKMTPDIKYLLMGSQCLAFQDQKLPQNVGLLGVVDEGTKQIVFDTVDFALNPTISGSGTNLKIFDYMAAGIPVITTQFGTRGIDDTDSLIIASIEEMPDVIEQFNICDSEERIIQAREYVEANFDWEKITKLLIEKINGIIIV